MSEYQHYEFLALDKPLTNEQRAELRKLSSRAEITATRFVTGASPPAEEPSDDGLAEWIASLPAAEKDSFLTMVADGEGTLVQALLLRRFRADAAGPASHSSPGRTAAELLEAAEARAKERKKAEEQWRREAQARKAAAEAAAYAKRLDDLAATGEAAWKQVDDVIATKKTSEYDQAVALLRDLRALAGRQGEVETAAFRKRVLDLRAQYPTRTGLQSRLDEAGFPR